MFDWVWNILYLVTKTLFKLIDGLVKCANLLCGVEPIKINGKETDIMHYLIFSPEVSFAFKVAALLGIVVVVVFSIIAILRTLAKEKAEGTPAQIVGKAVKSILSFLFIPTIMFICIGAGNIFMKAIYESTLQGRGGIGDFLFQAFAMESGVSKTAVDKFFEEGLSWKNTSDVWKLMDLQKFEFIFSWIAGGVILVSVGKAMIYFVDRILSIAILFIAAPFSIGSSVIDDGARFKLWRDQILVKFITGYGMMIAINIFALVCSLVMNPSVVFFSDGSLSDFLIKLLLIAGGGVTLSKSMALIGNLVSSGAGSNELRDSAIAGGLGGVIDKMPGSSILGAPGAIWSGMKSEASSAVAHALLPKGLQRNYGQEGGGSGGNDGGGSDSKNDKNPSGGDAQGNIIKNALLGNDPGGGDNNNENNDDNANNNDVNNDSMLFNAINNDNDNDKNNNNDDDGYDEIYN